MGYLSCKQDMRIIEGKLLKEEHLGQRGIEVSIILKTVLN
jgi:hypothetical protein